MFFRLYWPRDLQDQYCWIPLFWLGELWYLFVQSNLNSLYNQDNFGFCFHNPVRHSLDFVLTEETSLFVVIIQRIWLNFPIFNGTTSIFVCTIKLETTDFHLDIQDFFICLHRPNNPVGTPYIDQYNFCICLHDQKTSVLIIKSGWKTQILCWLGELLYFWAQSKQIQGYLPILIGITCLFFCSIQLDNPDFYILTRRTSVFVGIIQTIRLERSYFTVITSLFSYMIRKLP